jgi:hypothetical protein
MFPKGSSLGFLGYTWFGAKKGQTHYIKQKSAILANVNKFRGDHGMSFPNVWIRTTYREND